MITTKEAKNLIKRYEQLSARRDGVFRYSDDVRANIKKLFDKLLGTWTFKRAITNDLAKGIGTNGAMDPTFAQLIPYVYKYRKLEPLTADLDALNAKYNGYLQKKLKEISPAASGLRWAFTSSARKDEISRTYEEARSIIDGIYSMETERIVSEADLLKRPPENAVYGDYEANRFAYFKTIRSTIPDAGTRGGAVPEFKELEDRFAQAVRITDEAEFEFEKSKSDVAGAVDALVGAKLDEILKGIPVDELNRDKAGIRVNTLKDAGFTTLSDINRAGADRLSYINGIGRDTAELCKRLTREYAARARETIKIKLSADEKTLETSKLITAIYKYKDKKKVHDRLEEIRANEVEPVSKAVDTLRSAGNGSGWFFYSDASKHIMVDAYDYVRDFIASDVNRELHGLGSAIKDDAVATDPWADFSADTVGYIGAIEDICPGVLGNDDSIYGLPEDLALAIRDEGLFPDGLKCTLRRYQEWGVKYILHQGRVLLGDEMGLGKTIQAIAAMVSLKNTGADHFLVVCPASVLENWCREVAQHSALKPVKIHGDDKADALGKWLREGGVGITTYETTGSLLTGDWKCDMLVVDEAHYVKNPQAQRTRNVAALSGRAGRVLFMTGTALENRVDEMVNLVSMLNPDIAKKIDNIAFLSSAPQFRDAVSPVYYRSRREDVLTELPDLTETQEWCVLGEREESFYEWAVLRRNFTESRRVSWNVDDIKHSVKAVRMMELIEEAAEAERKVIVFSFFLDTMKKVCELLGDKCYGPINGSVPPAKRQEIIDEFDKAPAGSVLAAQIVAGGTGVNIQSASVVIICEPQLKPSTENQAISRAYRMGQSRNVLVYRLLCKDTIDERITEILEEKQQIFDAFADESAAAAVENVELDEKSLGDIIQEEIDRINAKKAR